MVASRTHRQPLVPQRLEYERINRPGMLTLAASRYTRSSWLPIVTVALGNDVYHERTRIAASSTS